MATMLPNIAVFAETGQWGALSPLCLVAASDNRATRELAQSFWMAKMCNILKPSAELKIEAEPGFTLPTVLGSSVASRRGMFPESCQTAFRALPPPEAESEDSRAVDPRAGSTGPGPAGNHVSAGTLK